MASDADARKVIAATITDDRGPGAFRCVPTNRDVISNPEVDQAPGFVCQRRLIMNDKKVYG